MRLRNDDGTVTVEYALTLPLVITLVGFIASVGVAAGARTTACEAARTVARQVAVGTDPAAAGTAVKQNLDQNLQLETSFTGDWVQVIASRPLAGDLAWTGLQVRCEARSWRQTNE